MSLLKLFTFAGFAASVAAAAQAVPVSYEGVLQSGQSAMGQLPTTGAFDDPSQAVSDYWLVAASAGQDLQVTVARGEQAFDVAFWLFEGFVFDDIQFGPELDVLDPGFVDFADDELPVPGPFGDPFTTVRPASDTFYSVIVTNYLSDPDDGDGQFPYTISVGPTAVPLPAGLPFLASALGLLTALRRRG